MNATPPPPDTSSGPGPDSPLASRVRQVRAYHELSKHQLQRYAAGPETLDWDAQPDPFRRYLGAPLTPLPLAADDCTLPWNRLFEPGAVAARPLDRDGMGLLLELSLALSAWKQQGPDRWAVRVNPSSGNLHPTEGWLISQDLPGVADGLHHYAPREHGLEHRAAGRCAHTCGPRAWLALSTIDWREAWKYGERAFRYGQLDIGHALGALRHAAAVLGWRLRRVPMGSVSLARLLGLDRDADYGQAEREEPELLLQIVADDRAPAITPRPTAWTWSGQASRLDRHPMYRWPVIATVARASLSPEVDDTGASGPGTGTPASAPADLAAMAGTDPVQAVPAGSRAHELAATLIRQRRSAQRFDARARAPLATLLPLLATLQSPRLPLDLGPAGPRVHVLAFVHRVDGLAPGAYLLPRRAAALPLLQQVLGGTTDWQVDEPVRQQARAAGLGELMLIRLTDNPALAGTLRTLNCHQALGSDALVALALLGEFDASLGPADDGARPWAYRDLFHEAGLLGQVLYLEAEAAGLAGTGIGCYFDDATHQLLGLAPGDTRLQSLYHFTVGVPVRDGRITSEPPYAHRLPVLPPPPSTDADGDPAP